MEYTYVSAFLYMGKIFAQPHTIVKQICFPSGNVVFVLSKNWMHNVVWGCVEILPSICCMRIISQQG